MIAVQVEIRQKNSQDPEIDEVLGADDKFKPGLLFCNHDLLATDFADHTDFIECELEIAKSAGINPPQLAALGLNLS